MSVVNNTESTKLTAEQIAQRKAQRKAERQAKVKALRDSQQQEKKSYMEITVDTFKSEQKPIPMVVYDVDLTADDQKRENVLEILRRCRYDFFVASTSLRVQQLVNQTDNLLRQNQIDSVVTLSMLTLSKSVQNKQDTNTKLSCFEKQNRILDDAVNARIQSIKDVTIPPYKAEPISKRAKRNFDNALVVRTFAFQVTKDNKLHYAATVFNRHPNHRHKDIDASKESKEESIDAKNNLVNCDGDKFHRLRHYYGTLKRLYYIPVVVDLGDTPKMNMNQLLNLVKLLVFKFGCYNPANQGRAAADVHVVPFEDAKSFISRMFKMDAKIGAQKQAI